MKGLKNSKILNNFSWLMGDKVIRMVVNLFVSVLVARYLGPEQLGYWNYLLSFTLFFSIFSSLGMDSIVPRELINQPEKEADIVTVVFLIKLLGGAIGFVLSLAIFYLYKQCGLSELLLLTLISSLMIFQSFEVFDYYFKSKLEAKYTIYARNTAFFILIILKLFLVWKKAALFWFIPTNALEMLIGGIFVFYFVKKKHQFKWTKPNWKLGKSLLKDGLPLALSGFLIVIYMRIDQIMVTDMIDETANGIYSTGVRMIEVLYFIPMALGESFFPGMVFTSRKNQDLYKKNILSFYSIMSFAGIGLTIITIIVAEPIMAFLFGAEYDGSGHVVFIYGLTLYATFINIAVSKYLTVENLLKIILFRSIAGVTVNLVLNLLFIPKYGYIGAAYASLISYYVVTIIPLFFRESRPQLGLMIKALDPRIAWAKIQEKK